MSTDAGSSEMDMFEHAISQAINMQLGDLPGGAQPQVQTGGGLRTRQGFAATATGGLGLFGPSLLSQTAPTAPRGTTSTTARETNAQSAEAQRTAQETAEDGENPDRVLSQINGLMR